eukprot:gene1551-12677_t
MHTLQVAVKGRIRRKFPTASRIKICPEHYNEDLKLFPRPESEKKEKAPPRMLEAFSMKKSTRQHKATEVVTRNIVDHIETKKRKEIEVQPEPDSKKQKKTQFADITVIYNKLQRPSFLYTSSIKEKFNLAKLLNTGFSIYFDSSVDSSKKNNTTFSLELSKTFDGNFQLAKFNFWEFDEKAIPLPDEKVQVLEKNLDWKNIQWNDNSITYQKSVKVPQSLKYGTGVVLLSVVTFKTFQNYSKINSKTGLPHDMIQKIIEKQDSENIQFFLQHLLDFAAASDESRKLIFDIDKKLIPILIANMENEKCGKIILKLFEVLSLNESNKNTIFQNPNFIEEITHLLSKPLKTSNYDTEFTNSLVVLYNCIHSNVKNTEKFFKENNGRELIEVLIKNFNDREIHFKKEKEKENQNIMDHIDNQGSVINIDDKMKEASKEDLEKGEFSFDMEKKDIQKEKKTPPKRKKVEKNQNIFYEEFLLTLLINELIEFEGKEISKELKNFLIKNVMKNRNFLSKTSSSLALLNLNENIEEINSSKIELKSKIEIYFTQYFSSKIDRLFINKKLKEEFFKSEGTYIEHYLNSKLFKDDINFSKEIETELKKGITHSSGYGQKDPDLFYEIGMLSWKNGKKTDALQYFDKVLNLNPGYFHLEQFFGNTCKYLEKNPNDTQNQELMYKMIELDCWGVCKKIEK